MNILDIILGVFLIIFLFKGFRKGFTKSVIYLLGLIVIVVLAAKTGYLVRDYLIFKFGFNEIFAVILSYVLIALFILVISKVVVMILHTIINFLNLKWLDKLLGLFFGFFNGVLIIALILIILDISPFEDSIRKFTSRSIISTKIRIISDKLEKRYPEFKDLVKPIEKQMEKLDEQTDMMEEKYKEKILNK